MNIRIDIESEAAVEVVHVSGRLVMPNIKHLADVSEQMEGNFVLDLSKLMFVDDEGVEVIRSLRKKGAEIRGASNFIQLLIDG